MTGVCLLMTRTLCKTGQRAAGRGHSYRVRLDAAKKCSLTSVCACVFLDEKPKLRVLRRSPDETAALSLDSSSVALRRRQALHCQTLSPALTKATR